MKKRRALIFVFIILAILVVPIPSGVYKDGGTRAYSALSYKIVKWQRAAENGEMYNKTRLYLFPNNFKTLDELWENESKPAAATGIELAIFDFTSSGLSFTLENATDADVLYGEEYTLSKFKSGEWEKLPLKAENLGFDSIGYGLKVGEQSEKTAIDWVWIYGKLPEGRYRFEKEIVNMGTVSAEFEVKE